jgi:hypothetical protein
MWLGTDKYKLKFQESKLTHFATGIYFMYIFPSSDCVSQATWQPGDRNKILRGVHCDMGLASWDTMLDYGAENLNLRDYWEQTEEV